MEAVRVHSQLMEVEARLRSLDLDSETLWQAISFGQTYVADATFHDPPSSVGITAWGKTVRMLRDLLAPRKWIAENHQNYAITVHPSGRWAVAVAAGDEQTGLDSPETRAPKGIWTSRMVDANRRQLSFAQLSPEWRNLSRQTWILLYYSDNEIGELSAELSLPVGMNEEGYVDEWQERIILARLGEVDVDIEVDGDDGHVDVPVDMKI